MESSSDIKVTVFGKTDVGLIREHNEDNFLLANADVGMRTSAPEQVLNFTLGPKGALFLVCDGMGGAAAGEVASTMAVESISADLSTGEPTTRERYARRLRRAIETANEKINAQSRLNQNERGMGTTCTAVCLVDHKLLVGQIGDSRCYILRSGQLAQLTKDQSLAWQLIEAGAMTVEEAKSFEHANIILQALGVQEKVDVVLSFVDLCRGDTILISSDGLHGPVSDEELKAVLLAESDPRKACETLIGKANERDGPDNITVVVARFDGPGLPEPEPNPVLGFAAFDPGVDPDDPEPVKATPRPVVDKATEEFPIPPETASPGAMPTSLVSSTASTPSVSHEIPTTNEDPTSRPFLTFILITLLAALGGALFLAFQKTNLPDLPSAPSTIQGADQSPSQAKTAAAPDATADPVNR